MSYVRRGLCCCLYGRGNWTDLLSVDDCSYTIDITLQIFYVIAPIHDDSRDRSCHARSEQSNDAFFILDSCRFIFEYLNDSLGLNFLRGLGEGRDHWRDGSKPGWRNADGIACLSFAVVDSHYDFGVSDPIGVASDINSSVKSKICKKINKI